MILQYYLSIYAINFFTFPTFSVRLINQQNGDCIDSMMLNVQLLSPNTFPVQIKFKGSEILLMKVKIIAFKSKLEEIVIGQGVFKIDKNTIQKSMRVPVYDKKQEHAEVALCSVDFYVSGNLLQKNVSIAQDKSKKNMEDWRDHAEDANYTHMSFTVQYENQTIEAENSPKNTIQRSSRQKQNDNKKTKYVESQNGSIRSWAQEQKIGSSYQINKLKRVQYYPLQPQSPIRNIAYLSQPPSLNKKYSRKVQNLPQLKPSQVKKQPVQKQQEKENSSIFDQNRQQDQNLDAQNLRQKLKQQEKIAIQLKRYLAKHKQRQKNYSSQIKNEKHKVRRKQLRVQQISSYRSQIQFINYFYEAQQKQKFKITKVKAHQITQNDIKDSNYSLGTEIAINKFNLSTINNQKLACFDSLGYRAYCIANNIKEHPAEINIPQSQQGLKVNVQLNNCGSFQGNIGVQQGQNMAVTLKPKDKDNELPVFKKKVFKLIFSIKPNSSSADVQETIKYQKNDISFRGQNQLSQPQINIRERIRSLSVQPWGYGYSYLNTRHNTQKDIFSKIKQKRQSIQIEAGQIIDESNGENQNKEKKKQPINLKSIQEISKEKSPLPPKREEQITKTPIISNQPYKRQRKKMKTEPKSNQIEQQSLEGTKKSKQQLNQIINIRNGNRNNYKFKKQNEQKKPNIKQIWEKLLIKKKVQQQGRQKQKLKQQPRKSPVRRFTNQQREIQSSIVEENAESPTKSKLYRVIPGVSRVMTVNGSENSPQSTQHLTPLRTITVDIKNISITQPLAIVSAQLGEMAGKFIKLEIKDKVVYYTEIIFNGQFNSILWKLSGCLFEQLTGNQHLEIEVYKTVENKITMLGKTSIRVSKLHFLRNNHIYNGKIMYNKILNGQFTLGFEVKENFPFEVIREDNDEFQRNSLVKPNPIDKNLRIRQTQSLKREGKIKNELRDQRLESILSSNSNRNTSNKANNQIMLMNRNNRMQLKDTLRREYNTNKKSNRNVQESLEVGVSQHQQSSLMPEGLALSSENKQK